MAPVAKRRTMLLAGSTSSRGTGLRPSCSAVLSVNMPRMVEQPLGLFVADLGIGAIPVERIAAHRVLQGGHRGRGPDMVLAADAIGVFAADVEGVAIHRGVAEGVAVAAHRLLPDLVEADPLDAASRCR